MRSRHHDLIENLVGTRIHASVPADDLLRFMQIENGEFDPPKAEALVKEGGPLAYAAARALDAEGEEWEKGVNSFTLSAELKRAVDGASWLTDIANLKHVLTSLVSKTLNSRCQARKYGTVAEKCLFETDVQLARYEATLASKDWTADPKKRPPALLKQVQAHRQIAAVRRSFKEVVLCALLGNYPHSTLRVHPREIRQRLYSLLLEGDAWFQALLHQCPTLVVWCVRDYLVHALLDDRGLREQIEGVMQLAKFQALVEQAMVSVRTYILQNIPYSWSSLCRESAPGNVGFTCRCMCGRRNGQPKSSVPKCVFAGVTWLADVTELLHALHEPMLAIAYRKPDTSELSFLLGIEVRKAAPLVQRPGYAPTSTQMPSDYDSDDDDDDGDSPHQVGHRLIRSLGLREHVQRMVKQRNDDDVARQRDDATSTRSLAYLTPVQFECLCFLVSRANTLLDLVTEVSRNEFGMHPESASYILRLLQSHRTGSVTKHDRVKAVVALQRRDPHSYNLLQVGAELLRDRDSRRARVVGDLPREAYEAQLAAAQAKWSTPGAVEETSVCLVACGVCGTVYSNVHDAHTLHHTFYRYGLFNVVRDYETGQVFCRRNKVNHKGSCRDAPLLKINLLGIRYSFERRVYQLCVRCGDIMVPDRRSCADASEFGGMICCDCTEAQTALRNLHSHTDRFLERCSRTCVCCNKRTPSQAATFLFPFNVVVCLRHMSNFLRNAVTQANPPSKAACVQAIVQVHTSWRERCRKRAQPQDNRRMKAARQRDRGRRC